MSEATSNKLERHIKTRFREAGRSIYLAFNEQKCISHINTLICTLSELTERKNEKIAPRWCKKQAYKNEVMNCQE